MTQTSPLAPATSNSVAAAILQRHTDRRRFDSADWAMAQQLKQFQIQSPPAIPAPLSSSRASSGDFSDWVECEMEPEPESPKRYTATKAVQTDFKPTVPMQQVRRIRLQRFDSADWALQCHAAKDASVTTTDTTVPTLSNTVAKLRLERHAYKTCSFVTTAVDLRAQHYVKNA